MDNKQFNVAFVHTMMTKNWNPRPMAWSEFLERLQKVVRTSETMSEYDVLDKSDELRTKLKDAGGAFYCGQLARHQRKKENFIYRSMMTLDADYADDHFKEKVHDVLSDFSYVLYESRSSRSAQLKYRLIVPLSKPLRAMAHEALSRNVADRIGIEYFDSASFEDIRAMYAVTASCDQSIDFVINDGKFLKLDDIIDSESEELWNPEKWPCKNSEKRSGYNYMFSSFTSDGKRKQKEYKDPREINGIAGDFNLLFPIDEAIDSYLQHVYEKEDDTHYTYIGGTSKGGLYIFNEEFTLAGSHHDSDIAKGTLWNSFNLVRIHLFGDMDDDVVDEPFWKWPSTNSMRYFLKNDLEFMERYENIDEVRAEFEKSQKKE